MKINTLFISLGKSIMDGNSLSSFAVPAHAAINQPSSAAVALQSVKTQSGAALDDISCMLGCTRSSLNIIEPENGMVVGRLKFFEDGCHIDCTKMGVSGKLIPPTIHGVDDMSSDALFILLVDKGYICSNLACEKFYNRFPCIIISVEGGKLLLAPGCS